MASAHYHRHRLSINQFQQIGNAGIFGEQDRIELINGEIIDMSPIGSRHAGSLTYMTRVLILAMAEQAIVSPQNPIILDNHSQPQPDIALLKPRADFYKNTHPQSSDVILVIEISDSSLSYDRDIKIPLYAQATIAEVWLVDLMDKQLEVFHTPSSQGYTYHQIHQTVNTMRIATLDIEVSLSNLFR